MDASQRRSPRPVVAGRQAKALVALVLAVVATACAAVGPGSRGEGAAVPAGGSEDGGADVATPAVPSDPTVRISAVGDVIMGSGSRLPPADGRNLFDGVEGRLSGDVVLANLDQALTDEARSTKCAPRASGCFAFRTPPSYAGRLREAGFTVINLANNHSHDFGDAGLRDTRAALTAHDLHHTGLPGQITVQRVDSLRVAVLGFAPYGWAQSLLDIPAAQQLVRKAADQADLVLVAMHAGAEGAGHGHVRPGTELFLGEDRGDAVAFSHAVIDAGADAVLGSGPHVLRGMEWYRGRLIAYSMGNFAGYRTLSNTGAKGVGGIVTLRLAPDGTWRSGHLTGTRLVDPGVPQIDPDQRALELVRTLSHADFDECGVRVGADGRLNAPTC